MDFTNSDWIKLVKRTREKFNVGIEEAHDLIVADAEMRRLVAWRINHNQECRKQALGGHAPQGRAVALRAGWGPDTISRCLKEL